MVNENFRVFEIDCKSISVSNILCFFFFFTILQIRFEKSKNMLEIGCFKKQKKKCYLKQIMSLYALYYHHYIQTLTFYREKKIEILLSKIAQNIEKIMLSKSPF